MNFNRIKKILVFLFFSIFFLSISNSYAVSETGWSAVFSDILVTIFDLIASIWYVLPIIAWKLLTNDLLYWISMHLDALLWHIWNFSRSLANFLIGFMFVYFIFKFISFEKDASLIKTNLPKIAFWAIIINASWFIIAVLIDVSTVLIAWFWALPLSVSNLNSKTKVAIPKHITFDTRKCDTKNEPWCFNWSYIITSTWDNNMSLDNLQSYEASISWPLFFIWTNILGITTSKQKLLDQAYDNNKKEFRHDWTAIKAIIQIIIILLFTVPLIVLIIVNIVRIFRVWIYIWFSPLIFLDQIFWWKVAASKEKAFWFRNMIWLIFQPALVVLAFSISFIFITALYSSLTRNWKTFKDAKVAGDYTKNVKKIFLMDDSENWIANIKWFWEAQDSSSKTEFIWWFFSYLIVSIIVIILLWTLIKLSFKASEVTSSISDSAFTFTEGLIKTANFIPTPMGMQSIWSIQKLWENVSRLPTSIASKQASSLTQMFWTVTDVEDSKVNSIITKLWITGKKWEWFKEAMNELSKFRNKNVVSSKANAKKLIDEIWKNIIKHLHPNLSVVTEFKSAQTYEKKLEVLLKNQNDIASNL